MRKMKIMFLVAAALILTACGGISKTVDMKYGESYKIEEEKLEGKNDVVWESEDNSIVTVSDDGTVTAKAPGKVKVSIKEGDKSIGTYTFNVTTVPIEQIIIATAENGVSAQYSVEVTPMSVWQKLNSEEKQFVEEVLPIMNNFKNPESVRFTRVSGTGGLQKYGISGTWDFTVTAQNGFGGNTVKSYSLYAGVLLEGTGFEGTELRADLITKAVHEKLGY